MLKATEKKNSKLKIIIQMSVSQEWNKFSQVSCTQSRNVNTNT